MGGLSMPYLNQPQAGWLRNSLPLAPKGTPRPAIDELNKQMSEAVRSPAVQSFIAKQSLEAVTDTPEEFKSFFESEKLRWSDVIKTAGVKVN